MGHQWEHSTSTAAVHPPLTTGQHHKIRGITLRAVLIYENLKLSVFTIILPYTVSVLEPFSK